MQASIAWDMYFGEKSSYGLQDVTNAAHVVCYFCTVSIFYARGCCIVCSLLCPCLLQPCCHRDQQAC